MIISDLNYLESAESSNIEGGRNNRVRVNVAVFSQSARSFAIAGRDGIALALSSNTAIFSQSN